MKYYLCLIFIISLQLFPVVVGAASDDVTFKIFVGDDLLPPSTPTLTSVTPVSSDQLDVVWSTSTDNWVFGGYVLMRDGTPIATTTLTSYSDTGLSPETLYSYSVYAFDTAGNISTTSNTVATTTLALPIIPPTPETPVGSGSQSTLVVRLEGIDVLVENTRATLRWSLNIPSRYLLRWGRTDTYTGGYVSNDVYQSAHVTTITDLEPGTRYEYELIGYTPAGRSITLKQGSFVTKTDDAHRVVANVERLMVKVTGNDTQLSFRIPESEAGAHIRVLRSHLGFPTDLTDGAIVYEGQAEEVNDPGALKFSPVQYYTVFVIGQDGAISSGAVGIAYRISVDGQSGESTDVPTVNASSTDGREEQEESEELADIILPLLEGNDIVINQNGTSYTFLDESIELSHREPFTLTIPKEALPRHLKSILVTILDPSDQRQSYAFLLRLNRSGTAYEATISPLRVSGASRIRVEVFDYDQLVVGRYAKPVTFIEQTLDAPAVVFPDVIITALLPLKALAGWILGFFGLTLGFLFWRRRRAEDKE